MKNQSFFLLILTMCFLCNLSCGSDEEVSPTTSCTDGIQNGSETGVDCGGDCEACPDSEETFSKILDISGEHILDGSISTSDEKIIMFGSSVSNPEMFCISSDREGNINWNKKYQIEGRLRDGIETSNGDFLLVGRTGAFPDYEAFVMKINNSGELLWQKSIPFVEEGEAYRIIKGADGGYIVVVRLDISGTADDASVICKIDENGDKVWETTFNVTKFSSVANTGNGYIIAGSTSGFERDVLLIKTDYTGNQLWINEIGGTGFGVLTDLIISSNGELYAVGQSNSFSGVEEPDLYLLKADENGNVIWQKTVNFPDYAIGTDIIISQDNSLIAVGNKFNTNTQEYNINLVKFDLDGNQITNSIVEECSDGAQAMRIYQESDGGYLLVSRIECFNGADEEIGFFKFNSNGEM